MEPIKEKAKFKEVEKNELLDPEKKKKHKKFHKFWENPGALEAQSIALMWGAQGCQILQNHMEKLFCTKLQKKQFPIPIGKTRNNGLRDKLLPLNLLFFDILIGLVWSGAQHKIVSKNEDFFMAK